MSTVIQPKRHPYASFLIFTFKKTCLKLTHQIQPQKNIPAISLATFSWYRCASAFQRRISRLLSSTNSYACQQHHNNNTREQKGVVYQKRL